MNVFTGEVFVEGGSADVSGVVDDLMTHFQERGYRLKKKPTPSGGWSLSITKGRGPKFLVGLKTALQIDLHARQTGIAIRTHGPVIVSRVVLVLVGVAIGVLVPILSWIIVAPFLLLHVWGLVRQASLDNEAIKVASVTLKRRVRLGGGWSGSPSDATSTGRLGADRMPDFGAPGPTAVPAGSGSVWRRPVAATGPARPAETFCTSCGARFADGVQFCGKCGSSR